MSNIRIHPQILDDSNPSSSSVNRRFLDALRDSRPKASIGCDVLFPLLGDEALSEAIFIIYGGASLKVVEFPFEYFNENRRWWRFGAPKNTILTLINSSDGKSRVWQFLHDSSAWMI